MPEAFKATSVGILLLGIAVASRAVRAKRAFARLVNRRDALAASSDGAQR